MSALEGSLEARYGRRTVNALLAFEEFASQAGRLVARGRLAYDADEMLRLAADAIVVKLGESVTRMDASFLTDHPQLPLRLIKDMRTLVAHEYDAIRPGLVWNTLERDLPPVAMAIADVLDRS
ncbi:MAG: HepT-like ribonuclease domain-containing protein [Nocardioides sp.]